MATGSLSSMPFHRVRHIMLQRTIAICVFSFFVLGTVSQSQAGGFLQRLRGKACSGRLVNWNRQCAISIRTCRPTPQACAPTTAFVDCDAEYQKNCASCERVYANDPEGKARCMEIARVLYGYCSGSSPVSSSQRAEVSSLVPPFCWCRYPEDFNGQTCLYVYDNALYISRYCAALCYFNCLNNIPYCR
jgi:hypothetical protein